MNRIDRSGMCNVYVKHGTLVVNSERALPLPKQMKNGYLKKVPLWYSYIVWYFFVFTLSLIPNSHENQRIMVGIIGALICPTLQYKNVSYDKTTESKIQQIIEWADRLKRVWTQNALCVCVCMCEFCPK